MSTILRLEGLEVGYQDLIAVHGVSLEVRAGEVVSLIGGRWCSDIVSRGIAHVPEGRQLFPTMSVRENLELGATVRGGRATALDGVFALFPRLREREHQLAGTLSGGEQQMCAIGRALM